MKRFFSRLSLLDLSLAHSDAFSKAQTQNDLVNVLKELNILRHKSAIDAMRRTDRALFTTNTYSEPYLNKPVIIDKSGATMSTPAHHALIIQELANNYKSTANEVATLIDLGCGTGYTTTLLTNYFLHSVGKNNINFHATECVERLCEISKANFFKYFGDTQDLKLTVDTKVEPLSLSFLESNNLADVINVSYSCDYKTAKTLVKYLKPNGLLVAPVLQEECQEQELTLFTTSSEMSLGAVLCQPSADKIITVEDAPKSAEEIKELLDEWKKDFEVKHKRKPTRKDIENCETGNQLFSDFSRARRNMWA